MKVELDFFKNGNLQLKIRFEDKSNFHSKELTWVPTYEELEIIKEGMKAVELWNKENLNKVKGRLGLFKVEETI